MQGRYLLQKTWLAMSKSCLVWRIGSWQWQSHKRNIDNPWNPGLSGSTERVQPSGFCLDWL